MRAGPSALDGRMLVKEGRRRAAAIRDLRDAGWKIREIAALFQVNDSTVRDILHGRRWRNVA